MAIQDESIGSATELRDAISKKHTQGADTALGSQTEALDMNTHKITGVVDPTADQEVATKKYVDDNTSLTEEYEFTAGESVVSGDLCYFKSDGKMWKADADAVATSKGLIVICLDTISADADGTFLLKGEYTTTGLTAGDELYISTTEGEWQNSPPSVSVDIVRIIGYSLSTTVLYFNPDKTYFEVA